MLRDHCAPSIEVGAWFLFSERGYLPCFFAPVQTVVQHILPYISLFWCVSPHLIQK